VVGHDAAQLVHPAAIGADGQHGALTDRAVVDLGFADLALLMRLQQLPAAQALQGLHAGVGQGNFAPVGLGLLQGQGRLLLQHRHLEPGLGQRDGKREPGGPRAHDEGIGMHGHWRKQLRNQHRQAVARTKALGAGIVRADSGHRLALPQV
jgi:hypothetical protein